MMNNVHLIRQGALQNAASGDLTHVTGAEFEDLGCDGVLLHQGLLGRHTEVRGQTPSKHRHRSSV